MTLPAADCTDFDPSQVSVTVAWERLAAVARVRVGQERVALAAAAGRVLATDLIAERDVPAFTNVAVDGWACRQADLEATGGLLKIAPGRAAAGHPFAHPLEPGTAVRVLTGAPLPEGADTVVMEEEARVEGDRIRLPAVYSRGRGVRPAGEDIRRGTIVIRAGTVLKPQHLGVAASLGQAELEVFRPLRIALFSSGDELAEPGAALGPGGIWDVNRPVLRALLRHLPASLTDLGILPDREQVVREAVLAAASVHDVVLTSGGASRGDEDHLARTLAACGRLHFWRVAMKPGRPLALGELGDALVITLPGNPVAAMVGFALFARPLFLALAGAGFAPPQFVELPAAFSMKKRGGRSEVLRARLCRHDSGRLAVARIEREGSGILTSMTEAEGLVLLSEAVEHVAPGDLVPFADFASLGIA